MHFGLTRKRFACGASAFKAKVGRLEVTVRKCLERIIDLVNPPTAEKRLQAAERLRALARKECDEYARGAGNAAGR